MKKQEQGFTLILALAILALVSGIGAAMTVPTLRESAQVKRHYARLQAEQLALAGVEYAKSTMATHPESLSGTFSLGTGDVSVTIEPTNNHEYHVTSVGRVKTAGSPQPVTCRIERRISSR